MRLDVLILCLAAFAIVAGVVWGLVDLGIWKCLNPRCPGCDTRQLESGGFIQSTTFVYGGRYVGRRATHGWTYYRCAACKKCWKRSSQTKAWEEPSIEEWDEKVTRGRPKSG